MTEYSWKDRVGYEYYGIGENAVNVTKLVRRMDHLLIFKLMIHFGGLIAESITDTPFFL